MIEFLILIKKYKLIFQFQKLQPINIGSLHFKISQASTVTR